MENTPGITNLKKGEKLVERTNWKGEKEYIVKGENDCWVATAFYGDTYHPDVESLRSFRNQLLENTRMGKIISYINSFYYFIGRTRFGKWWGEGANNDSSFLRRRTSKYVLLFAKYLVKTFNMK